MFKTEETKKKDGADNLDIDVRIVEYQKFQCERCGFIEGRAVAAFSDKFGILAPKKKTTGRQGDTKARMKKMKSTAKPRRQDPR